MLRVLAAGSVLVLAVIGGCSQRRPDPLQLASGNLTVHNQTDREWREVEIWLNRQFRVTVPTIAPDQRFQVNVNSFVAGFGQRFDFNRMQVTDLRLKGRYPDGEAFEIVKQFEKSGLGRAVGGKQ
jgi:hypothetical protein